MIRAPGTSRPRIHHALTALGSILLLTFLWQLIALEEASPLLPTPIRVLEVLWQELVSGRLPHHLGMTLARLIVSFLISMILGTGIGIILGRTPRLDQFFSTWLVIALNIPALVTIILCYVWFGLDEFAALLAVVINKLPHVIVTIREGARHLRQDLLDIAQVYRFGPFKTLQHVVWPQLFPYIMTAGRTGLALIWKIILVVELLGRSDGMGYQLNLFFQLFDVAGILAYSLAFIVIVQLIEWAILIPLDLKAQRWRR